MYEFFSTPLFSGEEGDEGKQFSTQDMHLTMSLVGEALQESLWRLHDVIGDYSRPWGMEPVWALAALCAATIGIVLLPIPLLLLKRNSQRFGHLRDPTCKTEKERLLTDQVWTSRTAIACLTRELDMANTKVAALDGQLEQLLAFVVDQETESAGEIRSLKDQAAHLETERALLLGVAHQQEQLIELLNASSYQRVDTEELQTCGRPLKYVEAGDGGVGNTE